jgi:hypothetical protein
VQTLCEPAGYVGFDCGVHWRYAAIAASVFPEARAASMVVNGMLVVMPFPMVESMHSVLYVSRAYTC